MSGAFLYGAAYTAGGCLVAVVFILCVATAARVREKVMAKRRCRMIRETLAGLGEEDLEMLLRGDGDTGKGKRIR